MMVVGSRLSARFLPGRHRTDCVIIVSSQGLRFSGVVIRHRASWPLGRTVLETVERFKWPRAIEAMTRYICWLAGWWSMMWPRAARSSSGFRLVIVVWWEVFRYNQSRMWVGMIENDFLNKHRENLEFLSIFHVNLKWAKINWYESGPKS